MSGDREGAGPDRADDIRDWAVGKHKQVDDRPFGGGPGMVLMAPPVVAATEAVRATPSRPVDSSCSRRRDAGSIKRTLVTWPVNID